MVVATAVVVGLLVPVVVAVDAAAVVAIVGAVFTEDLPVFVDAILAFVGETVETDWNVLFLPAGAAELIVLVAKILLGGEIVAMDVGGFIVIEAALEALVLDFIVAGMD